jgi:hypothetical protein
MCHIDRESDFIKPLAQSPRFIQCIGVANSTIMRKWKWLLVNGNKWKSLLSDIMFQLMPGWDKCINVHSNYVGKQLYFSGIHKPYATLILLIYCLCHTKPY